jgi:hypothetical protein
VLHAELSCMCGVLRGGKTGREQEDEQRGDRL